MSQTFEDSDFVIRSVEQNVKQMEEGTNTLAENSCSIYPIVHYSTSNVEIHFKEVHLTHRNILRAPMTSHIPRCSHVAVRDISISWNEGEEGGNSTSKYKWMCFVVPEPWIIENFSPWNSEWNMFWEHPYYGFGPRSNWKCQIFFVISKALVGSCFRC